MSQWAAQAMAEEGADYREILGTFYPGTTLLTVEEQGRRFAILPVGAQSRVEQETIMHDDKHDEKKGDRPR